jgi:hypothetical protein
MLLKKAKDKKKSKEKERRIGSKEQNAEQTSLFLSPRSSRFPAPSPPERLRKKSDTAYYYLHVLEADHTASLPAHFSWIFHRSD